MKIFSRICHSLWLLILTAVVVGAGELKVDINRGDSKNTTSATATGYVRWATSTDGSSTTSTGTSPITESFVVTNTGENVTVSLAMTAAAQSAGGTGLTFTYYALNMTEGWKLASDGITVNPAVANSGGQIQMTITGLAAGDHSLLTFHNAGDSPAALISMAPINVYLNGNYVTSVTPSIRTNDLSTPTVYLNFTTASSNDATTILFAADTNSAAATKNVVLNGFEIDTPNSSRIANSPVPADRDEHVDADSGSLILEWSPAIASNAVSHDVYFGTNQTAVKNATHASPEFKGNQVITNYMVIGLDSMLTYYWRIDEIDSIGNASRGTVWMFRTRHLAFPGAEGYGRFARGGRGGVVIEVTNLNDSGPGSYRAAVQANGPRTVVFKVSGLIRLQSPCVIGNGYLYIAGQTAPGDGICLANWRAGISSCSDVIIRFMRCRLGDASQQAMDGMGLGNSTHSIIDHCSISWTMDEATSSRQSGAVGTQSAMVTFHHNVISEPLQYSYHYDGDNRTNYEPHAFAGSISGEIASYHHNLIAHSTDRNWSLAGGLDNSVHYAGSLDIRDNVVYNWRGRTTDGGVARLNYVNNYYKPCPANFNVSADWLLRLDAINTNWGTLYIHMTNNVWQGRNYYPNNWVAGSFVNGLPLTNLVVTNSEIYPSYVDTQTASNALKLVLSDSGCDLQLQDAIDRRIIGEVIDGTWHYKGTNANPYIINGVPQPKHGTTNYPGFIDSQTDVKDFTNNPAAPNYSPDAPWPPYYTYNVPVDSDHDGMPDWWELAKGLNPNSPSGDFSDSNGDSDGDGYLNLEDYLNWLAAPHFDATRNVSLDIDLTQFTRGFTNSSPTYAIMNPTNGSLISLSGGKVARFTPTGNFYGLGSFQFKVTAGSFSYTNSINLHVRALPASQISMSNTSQLHFSGESSFYYLLQYSDDLQNWTTWTNTIAIGADQVFAPFGSSSSQRRFFRALSIQ